ncbi:hypothetical protein, partial [Vibrio mediterranei]|uniref:hypothetical protein n=1 Tax=Vibrio mediterranei TaxID=689 RepID=UPI004067EDC3
MHITLDSRRCTNDIAFNLGNIPVSTGSFCLIKQFVSTFIQLVNCPRIQVRSATLRHLSSHAHFLEYYGW